ncbi:hypothetical protein BJV82DRAFT_585886 [Fennellomyces sp. T-0311]|nr:hypothetical protein BJV82DRAFT_585886 [Fennellomyces sp. T-0311]
MHSLQLSDQSSSALLGLPNELLLYILKQFLGLDDLWRLLQVSRAFRHFAMHTIHRGWKIELSPDTVMKVQCRAALVALETLSCQLSSQTRVTPFAYQTSYLSANTNPAASSSASASGMPDPAAAAAIGLLDQRRSASQRSSSPYYDDEEEEDDDDDIHPQQLLLLGSPTSPMDDEQRDNNNNNNSNKLFHHLMRREERLHQRIVLGISSYKHKYVLIEDIDIRNRIRSAVDVIFHHAVFVAAVSRAPVRLACTHASSNNRALAAMMVRLLTRLDVAFPACCREITFTLADNIKAFLEYTGYKLISISANHPKMSQQQGEALYAMVFGPACQSAAICNNEERPSIPQSSSSSSASSPLPHNLLVTLHSISACFDLMGAAFIGKILSENHVECAVQRACELLSDSYLRPVKRALLVDLLEGWLTIKRGLVASELCRWVRTEIERCDQQSSPSATAMRATSSLHPPLSDLVSFAHIPMA